MDNSILKAFLIESFGNDFETASNPIDRRMKIINDLGIHGMNTENIRYTINELVKRYAKTYLEVGSYQGASIISAAIFNENVRCIAIDNFSEFDPEGKNKSIFLRNIQNAGIKNVELHDVDYRIAISEIFKNEISLSVDVYFYDGNHSYEDQINGLNIMKNHMSDSCIIFVDDCNCYEVNIANDDWLRDNKDFKHIKIFTERNQFPTWWNGFTILYRNLEKKHEEANK